jgi:hypothetical protein
VRVKRGVQVRESSMFTSASAAKQRDRQQRDRQEAEGAADRLIIIQFRWLEYISITSDSINFSSCCREKRG